MGTAMIIGVSLGSGVATYFLVLGVMYLWQRRLLYKPHPNAGTPAKAGVPEMSEVKVLTRDGLELGAWWRAPIKGYPTVLIFHGNTGTRADAAYKAKPYLNLGYGVFLMDYRGYAENPGEPTERGLRLDAEAARAFVLSQGVTAERIILHGESLGSGVAIWLASEHRPAALVVEAAFASIPAVAAERYPWLPTRVATRDRFSSLKRIPRVFAPLLVLHGGKDPLVPVDQARALHAAHPGPKRLIVIAEALHANLYDYGAADLILKWLASQGL